MDALIHCAMHYLKMAGGVGGLLSPEAFFEVVRVAFQSMATAVHYVYSGYFRHSVGAESLLMDLGKAIGKDIVNTGVFFEWQYALWGLASWAEMFLHPILSRVFPFVHHNKDAISLLVPLFLSAWFEQTERDELEGRLQAVNPGSLRNKVIGGDRESQSTSWSRNWQYFAAHTVASVPLLDLRPLAVWIGPKSGTFELDVRWFYDDKFREKFGKDYLEKVFEQVVQVSYDVREGDRQGASAMHSGSGLDKDEKTRIIIDWLAGYEGCVDKLVKIHEETWAKWKATTNTWADRHEAESDPAAAQVEEAKALLCGNKPDEEQQQTQGSSFTSMERRRTCVDFMAALQYHLAYIKNAKGQRPYEVTVCGKPVHTVKLVRFLEQNSKDQVNCKVTRLGHSWLAQELQLASVEKERTDEAAKCKDALDDFYADTGSSLGPLEQRDCKALLDRFMRMSKTKVFQYQFWEPSTSYTETAPKLGERIKDWGNTCVGETSLHPADVLPRFYEEVEKAGMFGGIIERKSVLLKFLPGDKKGKLFDGPARFYVEIQDGAGSEAEFKLFLTEDMRSSIRSAVDAASRDAEPLTGVRAAFESQEEMGTSTRLCMSQMQAELDLHNGKTPRKELLICSLPECRDFRLQFQKFRQEHWVWEWNTPTKATPAIASSYSSSSYLKEIAQPALCWDDLALQNSHGVITLMQGMAGTSLTEFGQTQIRKIIQEVIITHDPAWPEKLLELKGPAETLCDVMAKNENMRKVVNEFNFRAVPAQAHLSIQSNGRPLWQDNERHGSSAAFWRDELVCEGMPAISEFLHQVEEAGGFFSSVRGAHAIRYLPKRLLDTHEVEQLLDAATARRTAHTTLSLNAQVRTGLVMAGRMAMALPEHDFENDGMKSSTMLSSWWVQNDAELQLPKRTLKCMKAMPASATQRIGMGEQEPVICTLEACRDFREDFKDFAETFSAMKDPNINIWESGLDGEAEALKSMTTPLALCGDHLPVTDADVVIFLMQLMRRRFLTPDGEQVVTGLVRTRVRSGSLTQEMKRSETICAVSAHLKGVHDVLEEFNFESLRRQLLARSVSGSSSPPLWEPVQEESDQGSDVARLRGKGVDFGLIECSGMVLPFFTQFLHEVELAAKFIDPYLYSSPGDEKTGATHRQIQLHHKTGNNPSLTDAMKVELLWAIRLASNGVKPGMTGQVGGIAAQWQTSRENQKSTVEECMKAVQAHFVQESYPPLICLLEKCDAFRSHFKGKVRTKPDASRVWISQSALDVKGLALCGDHLEIQRADVVITLMQQMQEALLTESGRDLVKHLLAPSPERSGQEECHTDLHLEKRPGSETSSVGAKDELMNVATLQLTPDSTLCKLVEDDFTVAKMLDKFNSCVRDRVSEAAPPAETSTSADSIPTLSYFLGWSLFSTTTVSSPNPALAFWEGTDPHAKVKPLYGGVESCSYLSRQRTILKRQR
ncbi:unnamed protein product [Amoebophrya sp. A120]|nr:unnamed protein product [Amoebophrya sp. A120]|eukprot:GSA120T00017096001.1